MTMKALTLAGSVVVGLCVTAACSDRTKEEAREAGQEVAEAARAAGDAVKSAAQDTVDNVERAREDPSVKEAGERAKGALGEAADAAAAAAQTAKVKAALVADSSVTAAGIDVDTLAGSRTIVLKGRVPTEAQKSTAGRIAEEKASPGYTVRNELVVTASGS
jgi:osmotically-inducible protein OsmY